MSLSREKRFFASLRMTMGGGARNDRGESTEGQRMGAQKDKGWVHRRTKDGCTEGQRVGAQKDNGGMLSF